MNDDTPAPPIQSQNKKRGITRRRLLSLSLLAGGAALGLPRPASARPEFSGWPKSYGMLVDLTLCVGCRSCEQACNEANNLPKPEKPFDDDGVFKEKRWPSAKAYTVVNRYPNPKDKEHPLFRKIQCNHCLEPACATACPIKAYTKTEQGAVVYNEDLCFGCRYCVIACPFNIPGYDYESAFEAKVVKCTFCNTRIAKNELPACAAACPSGALAFGKRTDLIKMARKRIMENPKNYMDHVYGEREVGGTSWMYLSGIPFDHYGLPENLPKKPLIELTEGYLSSVPVIFTTFPAIFGMLYAALHRKENKLDGPEKPGSSSHEVNHE